MFAPPENYQYALGYVTEEDSDKVIILFNLVRKLLNTVTGTVYAYTFASVIQDFKVLIYYRYILYAGIIRLCISTCFYMLCCCGFVA